MSSISKAGIFIDVKQLLTFTYLMNKEMSNADRRDFGSMLIKYNLDMITAFTLAFHRRDEKIAFDTEYCPKESISRGARLTEHLRWQQA